MPEKRREKKDGARADKKRKRMREPEPEPERQRVRTFPRPIGGERSRRPG